MQELLNKIGEALLSNYSHLSLNKRDHSLARFTDEHLNKFLESKFIYNMKTFHKSCNINGSKILLSYSPRMMMCW